MLTLTAPGDKPHRLPNGRLCPCWKGEATDVARWNAGQSKCWNHLRTVLKRQYPTLQFMRAVETQKRGALHLHVLLYSAVPLSKRWVRERAIAAGFGHSVDIAPYEIGSRQAAYYVSKYVTKAADARGEVPWAVERIDQETGEIFREETEGRYRTWSQSASWGPTMLAARDACARSLYLAKKGVIFSSEVLILDSPSDVVARERESTHSPP